MPAKISAAIRQRAARIKLFLCDVDGVLTDGTIALSSTGVETKRFSVQDGAGMKSALQAGFELAWISGRPSPVTTRYAAKMGVRHVLQGRNDKLAALQELAKKLGFAAAQCLYMGDDVIDVPAMRWAGIGVSVPSAMPLALEAADCITIRDGGQGAVRQVCDRLLAARTSRR